MKILAGAAILLAFSTALLTNMVKAETIRDRINLLADVMMILDEGDEQSEQHVAANMQSEASYCNRVAVAAAKNDLHPFEAGRIIAKYSSVDEAAMVKLLCIEVQQPVGVGAWDDFRMGFSTGEASRAAVGDHKRRSG